MSGPITPPLTVETVDGATEGRPITTIKVSNGDLTISGNTATIDTTGSGGSPGGSTTEVQYNNAGSFAGDAGFIIDTAGAGDTTKVRIGKIMYGGSRGAQNVTLNGSVWLTSEGTGQILLSGSSDAGGTWTDTIVQVLCNAAGDDSILTFKNNSGTAKEAKITLDGSLDFIIDNTYAGGGNIELLPGSGNYVKIGGGAATGTLTSNGAYDLQLSTNSGTNSGLIAITNGVNGSIDITPNGSGLVKVSNLTVAGNYSLPTAVTTTNDYVLTAQTDGSTAWAEASGGGSIMERGYKTATYYNMNPIQMYTQTTQALNANKIRCMPFLVNKTTSFDRIMVYAASTSGTADLSIGLYNMGSDGEPSTNILTEEFSNISTGYHTANISQSLDAGWYFYFVWCNESVNYGITNTTAGSLGSGLVQVDNPTYMNYGGSVRVFNSTYATGSAPSLASTNPNQIEAYNINCALRAV